MPVGESDKNRQMLATQVLFSVEMGLLLLAGCVLIGPVLAERVRVPGLIGLIAVGMLLGPNVLEWLRQDGFVATVGVAGLLYLMFTAGDRARSRDLRRQPRRGRAAITFQGRGKYAGVPSERDVMTTSGSWRGHFDHRKCVSLPTRFEASRLAMPLNRGNLESARGMHHSQ